MFYYLSNKTQINGLKQQKRLIKQQQQQIKALMEALSS